MNTHAYQLELAASRIRVRQALLVSCGLHAALIIFLLIYRPPAPVDLGAVEIDWLNAAPPVVKSIASPPAPRVKEEEAPPQVAQTAPPEEQRFERPEPAAVEAPLKQTELARVDRLSDKLQALRASTNTRKPLSVSTANASSLLKSVAAPAGPAPVAGKSVDLNHASRPSAPALALNHNAAGVARSTMAAVEVPHETHVAVARADRSEASTTELTLDGATLAGPAAGREVLHHELPAYPDWAMEQAIEASVTIYFVVLPDGRVKDNVQVEKTGGYSDFDRNAATAIKRWRFKPLPQGQRQEQWGTISFRYRLRDSGR